MGYKLEAIKQTKRLESKVDVMELPGASNNNSKRFHTVHVTLAPLRNLLHDDVLLHGNREHEFFKKVKETLTNTCELTPPRGKIPCSKRLTPLPLA